MSHFSWTLPLALSFGLFACGGEDSTAPAPEGGVEASGAASGSQDSTGTSNAGLDENVGDQLGEDLGEKVKDSAESAMAEADTLIETVTAYLQENKLELARTAFAKLSALKDQLPASYQAQIEKLRSLIEGSGLGDKANDLIKGLGGLGGGG